MKRLSTILIIALVAMVALQAIAQDAAPQAGGTLRAAWDAEWTGLDPHIVSTVSSARILDNVVEPLTAYDDSMRLGPMLAESWVQSEDGLTWTFTLRQDVTFSNGRAMTAEDVKWSMDRIIDPATGSGRVAQVGGADAVWTVIDDYTVSVTTSTPNAILPNLLAASTQAVVAHESVGENGQIVVPIGTGPFIIGDVQGTTNMTLVKNPNYWQEGLPHLDEVNITVISEDAPREAALVGGEVDWLLFLAPQSVESLEASADITVDSVPGLNYFYIGINTLREPLDDVLVRQAIAYAIDRQQLCDAGWFGLCTPVQGPTGPSSPWYFDYAPYTQDLDMARSLLEQAGYPDGFEMELLPTSSYPDSVRQAQVLQQQLAAVGITTTINAPEWAEWLELEGSGNYDGYICSWNGLTDANDYYYLQHRTGEVFNFTGYSNPDFDALVDEGRSLSDFDERYAVYEQANKILVDEAPYIYFYNNSITRAYKSYVQGYVTRPDGANFWLNTWLDQ
ncbi:MAG: ABC transporter substrate-binding protein [Chloroflexi bacterium]|nr:ABC transporter substrate-binding protein [Chloroflexota bacterium]